VPFIVSRESASVVVVATIARLPAGDLEDHAVAGDAVLNAREEAVADRIEDPARPFRVEIVERSDADAAIPSFRQSPLRINAVSYRRGTGSDRIAPADSGV
jgi:hypothetical protein